MNVNHPGSDDLDEILDSEDFGLRNTDFGRMLTTEERDFAKKAISFNRSQTLSEYKSLTDAAVTFFTVVSLGTASLPVATALKLSAYVFLRGAGKTAEEAGDISSRWVESFIDKTESTAKFIGKFAGDAVTSLVSMATGIELPSESDQLPNDDISDLQASFAKKPSTDDSDYLISYTRIFNQINQQGKLQSMKAIESDARAIAGVYSEQDRVRLIEVVIRTANKSLGINPIESTFVCLRSYWASNSPWVLEKFRGRSVVDVEETLNRATRDSRLWIDTTFDVGSTKDDGRAFKSITLDQIFKKLPNVFRNIHERNESEESHSIVDIICGNCGFHGEVEFGKKLYGNFTTAHQAHIVRLVRNGRPANSQVIKNGEALCPKCEYVNRFIAYYRRPSQYKP